MRYPSRSQSLGGPAVIAMLEESVGSECTITTSSSGEEQAYSGHVVHLEGARVAVSLQYAAQVPEGDSLHVSVAESGVNWESTLITRRSPFELLLSYPLWCCRLDRRTAERVTVDLPCRYGLIGETRTDWYSGILRDIGMRGVRLVGPAPVAMGYRFVIRLSVPSHPVPVLLHARSVWTSHTGYRHVVGGEIQDLSLQTETILRNCFGLKSPHNCPI